MISPMDHIDEIVHAELVGSIIIPEAVRAFIHPVAPFVWHHPDELAEIAETWRMQQPETD